MRRRDEKRGVDVISERRKGEGKEKKKKEQVDEEEKKNIGE